jgi:cell division topological specificity factor
MSLFDMFRRKATAPVARERLQILLAHERAVAGGNDLVSILKEEILAVIARHVRIEPEHVRVTLDRGAQISTLEVDVEIPTPVGVKLQARG